MSILFLVLLGNVLSTVIPLLTIGLSLAFVTWVWLEVFNRLREILHLTGIDFLELKARYSAQEGDKVQREIGLLEASYQMRVRRLELQGKRLELLDSLESEEVRQ